jgi:hypothetical protein
MTNEGVHPSTASLCDDLSLLCLQEEALCGEQHQSLCRMQRL